MRKFIDILNGNFGLSPAEQQLYAQEQFHIVIANSNMGLWKLGDPTNCNGRRVIVGVAVYSVPDLQLLDALNEMLFSSDLRNDCVQVFSVSECQAQEDFEKYVPGIGKVFQTPVVGVWEDGLLVDKAWGAAARDMISQYYPRIREVLLVGTRD